MNIRTEILTERGLVTYTATGDVELPHMVAAMRETFGDPRYPVPTRALWNVSRAHLLLSAGEMAELLSFVAENRPPGPGRVAILVSADLEFGRGRMFGAQADGLETSVFRSESEALSWLMEEWC